MTESADVIVIGLGAMGSSALYQLASRGVSVLGIDRFAPPHVHGSTHGEVRITRLSIAEGDKYVPFVARSHRIWRELETATGRRLLDQVGCLMLAPRDRQTDSHGGNFVQNTIDTAARRGIAHRLLDNRQIATEFPQFKLTEPMRGYFEPEGGFVRPEECVRAQLDLASARGARLQINTRVTGLRRVGQAVEVATDQGVFQAAKVILSSGAWLPGLVGGWHQQALKVQRQVQFWFEVEDVRLWQAAPVFIRVDGMRTHEMVYGFPITAPTGPAMAKFASEQDVETTDPDAVRPLGEDEGRAFHAEHVVPKLNGIGTACRGSTCLYTTAPDYQFRIGAHPDMEGVTLISACSGHGFKHSGGIGEAVAEHVLGSRTLSGFD